METSRRQLDGWFAREGGTQIVSPAREGLPGANSVGPKGPAWPPDSNSHACRDLAGSWWGSRWRRISSRLLNSRLRLNAMRWRPTSCTAARRSGGAELVSRCGHTRIDLSKDLDGSETEVYETRPPTRLAAGRKAIGVPGSGSGTCGWLTSCLRPGYGWGAGSHLLGRSDLVPTVLDNTEGKGDSEAS